MIKRKSHYCKRIADKICEEVALGLPLTLALKKAGPLAPAVATFWHWLKERPELKADYQEALQFQANMHADKMLELAIGVEAGKMPPANARFAAEVYKWHAEMRDPAQYSPKGAQAIPPTAKSTKEMKVEVERLQAELGIDAQPGMVTAPRVLRQKQEAGRENPAPTPNLKLVNGVDEPGDE